jgi:hypothetical protein
MLLRAKNKKPLFSRGQADEKNLFGGSPPSGNRRHSHPAAAATGGRLRAGQHRNQHAADVAFD